MTPRLITSSISQRGLLHVSLMDRSFLKLDGGGGLSSQRVSESERASDVGRELEGVTVSPAMPEENLS